MLAEHGSIFRRPLLARFLILHVLFCSLPRDFLVGDGDGAMVGGDEHVNPKGYAALPDLRRGKVVGPETSGRDHNGVRVHCLQESFGVGGGGTMVRGEQEA